MKYLRGSSGLVLLIAVMAACSAESTLEPANGGNSDPIGNDLPDKAPDEGLVETRIVCTEGSSCGMLAFVSDRSGNREIYTIKVDGTELKRLTDDPAVDIDPAWSPDGQRIAFISNRNGRHDLFVMNADGSDVVQLTKPYEWQFAIGSPTWSPDGKRVAFLSGDRFGVVDVAARMPVATAIGFSTGYLASPAWSPDGSRIAFVSDWHAYDFMYDVFVMNPDGSNIRPLLVGKLSPANYFFEPAWSADGGRIAAVACVWAWDNCYPDSRVVVANADGSDLRVLTRSGGFSHPTWSKDGSMIAFSSQICRTCPSSIRYVRTDISGVGGPIVDDGYSPSWRP